MTLHPGIAAAQGPEEDLAEITGSLVLDEGEVMTFAEWQAQRPSPAPLYLKQVAASQVAATTATGNRVVYVLVAPPIYDGIAASLAQWELDVENSGWQVVIYTATFPDPPTLRNYLAGVANLDGLILIGDFPVPWYEHNTSEFPFDTYYMDLNGSWRDDDQDGLYDAHTGDTAPEIWVGRLTAGNLTYGGSEVELLNNYFAKNHAYRNGSLVLPQRGLVYVDDDWTPANGIRQSLGLVYPEVTHVTDPDTTRATDYAQHLVESYAWVYILAHSTAHYHKFTYHVDGIKHNDTLNSQEVYQIDPHAFFYNLFACASGRFTEDNYLAGWYTFGRTYGLVTIASTKGGGMVRGHDLFFQPLSQGKELGEAYRDWFAVEGIADIGWHYGLTLIGDPTLKIIHPESPTGLLITGPITGAVHTVHTFTATVVPETATLPISYTWQATGQTITAKNNDQNDTMSFDWWYNTGPKIITVTARNFAGLVTNTYTITITDPEIAPVVSAFSSTTLPLGTNLSLPLVISNTGSVPLKFEVFETIQPPAPTGGPDSFGYLFADSADSNDGGGPVYQWYEIAPPAGGSGIELTELTGAWRGYTWPITLPFSFNFYGQAYTKLAVSPQGAFYFEDRWMTYKNKAIPSLDHDGPETFIAPLWSYQYIAPGAVYYQDLGSMFIVEFYRVSRPNFENNPITWQVILFKNGNIKVQYQDITSSNPYLDKGNGATVGLQANGLAGLQYSFNEPVLADNMAICFAYPGNLPNCSSPDDVAWLSARPTTGVIPPNNHLALTLTFDAAAPDVTVPGEYGITLVGLTNDLDNWLITIPVTMNVIPPVYQLSLDPTSAAKSGDPGTPVTYTFQLTNTGNMRDTFALTGQPHIWPTTFPDHIGPLMPDEAGTVTLAVTIPANVTGGAIDRTVITIVSQGDSQVQASTTLTTIANSRYDLVITPALDARSGAPGTTLIYTIQITNSGNVTDMFTFSSLANAWPTVVPKTVGPLAVGASAFVDVKVHIPAGAINGATDRVTITVASSGDTAKQALTSLTSLVSGRYGISVRPISVAQTGNPGTPVTYTLQLTNTGNMRDTFALTGQHHIWPTTFPDHIGPLMPGETITAAMRVTIPDNAAGDTIDKVVITVASQGASQVQASAAFTTGAKRVYSLMIAPALESWSGAPGATLTHTIRITNTGNTTDTFNLQMQMADPTWPVDMPTTVGPIAAGTSQMITARITIPLTAPGNQVETTPLIVTSQGNHTKQARVLLKTAVNIVCDVIVGVDPKTQFASPGATLTYTLSITNAGNFTDTFDLQVAKQAWSISIPAAVGPLAVDDTMTVVVNLTIPISVGTNEIKELLLTVTSQNDHTRSDQVTFIAGHEVSQSPLYKIYLPFLTR